jgi:hypothetical protein
MPMIVCYIAGPYTETKTCTVEQNIDNARRVASEIRSNGMAAVVPHLESLGCAESLDYEGWMEHGFALLNKCDCVVLLEGWRVSKGTIREVDLAKWNKQPIFFSWEDGYIKNIQQWWGHYKWKR